MRSLASRIRSYLNLRESLIRKLAASRLSKQNIMVVANLTDAMYHRRRLDPSKWTIDEIDRLSHFFGYDTSLFKSMQLLAFHLSFLTPLEQAQVFKQIRINRKKLAVRQADYNNWQLVELESLAKTLEHL